MVKYVLAVLGLGCALAVPILEFKYVQQDERICVVQRKTITVYADNETNAGAIARRQNPGWMVQNVIKRGNGRAYQVVLTK